MEIRKYLDFETDFEEIREAVLGDWGGNASAILEEVSEQGKEGQLARLLDMEFGTADLGDVCEYLEVNSTEIRKKLDLN